MLYLVHGQSLPSFISAIGWEDKQSVLKSIENKPIAAIIQSPYSPSSLNSNDLYHDIDKVQAKMAKFALGVSKFTSNTAVFRE